MRRLPLGAYENGYGMTLQNFCGTVSNLMKEFL